MLLVGIEAAYYVATAGLLVADYAVQAAAMTKVVLGPYLSCAQAPATKSPNSWAASKPVRRAR